MIIDKRGRHHDMNVVTMPNMGVPVKEAREDGGRAPGFMPDVEKMSLRGLKKHICPGAPCATCDVMCGYGRRYLELVGGKHD